MQPWPGGDPAAVNRLMNYFTRALKEIGQETTTRFLQDRYSFIEYIRIMLTTAKRYPAVVPVAVRVFGPKVVISWAGDIAHFASNEILRMGYRVIGPRIWKRIEQRAPSTLSLRLRAWRSTWQAVR